MTTSTPTAQRDPSAAQAVAGSSANHPTVWGLTPHQVYDRFWASRGVQVVRQGVPSEIVQDAELFLLIDPRSLVLFKLTEPIEKIIWLSPRILYLRLVDNRPRPYREAVVTDPHGRFQRFERLYAGSDPQLIRAALTADIQIARLWQNARSPRAGWRLLRRTIDPARRAAISLTGRVYDAEQTDELMQCLRTIIERWKRPDSTIPRAVRRRPGVWSDRDVTPPRDLRCVGNLWVGAGRQVEPRQSAVGPAVLWDDPAHRPTNDAVQWKEIEPIPVLERAAQPRQMTSLSRAGKRAFDILFALLGLAFTLPFYPLVMLAIFLEDGRPFFFSHRRETLGGREFPCIKFRSMRRDADKLKQQLRQQNQADGPQFFIQKDPRLTRVGVFLRRFQIDELPQFWNVLLGHMSVVGPRPSPYAENQYCPPWREARLSVRPGLTGLWQVSRTRQAGLDFQEWIRFDIQYVENVSWALDVWIIYRTVLLVLKGTKET